MADQLQRVMMVGGEIESLRQSLDIDYIEACLMYCEKYDIEVETLGEVIKNHQNMVSKIRKEAEDLHFIEKTTATKIEFE